jgi:hypothetical protein
MAITFLAKLNDKVKIAELKATHDFKIIDLDKVVISTDAGLMIADGVLIQLFSICISSIRGMYAAKLADSLYNNAIFPVTDVSRLIPKKPSPIG